MKRAIFIFIFLLAGSAFTSSAYPYWIWTPKTNRWVNPKHNIKPSPKEQLKSAKELYSQGKYKETIIESQKLIKHFPKAYEASEAQFYIGLSFEGLDDLYKAFKAYQRVIDKYPFSGRTEEIIERELKIGESFMFGKKPKAFGLELPIENPALEIFRKVVENSNYGKNASHAQYLLGMTLKNLNRFQEARDELERVVTTYPDSAWAPLAKFQAADCESKIAPKIDYDQELTKEAKKKFEDFVDSHPDTNLIGEAQSKIDKLKEKEAEGALKIAEFYEKQKKYDSARIYYEEIAYSCPYCLAATKAREKLKELETK